MAYFMVDLENTNSSGLVGANYLLPTDCVSIFYSESCSKIQHGLLQDIFDSGCMVETCKLFKKGDNALDFYIASRIGSLFGGGYKGHVIIVTGDKGLTAVTHYWQQCAVPHHNVHVRPNIEQGILSSGEGDTPRMRQIKARLEVVSLEEEMKQYRKSQQIRTSLQNLFRGTDQEDKLEDIMEIISGHQKPGKVLYLSTLKQFGRKDGLEIYRKLRLLEQK